MAEEIRRVPSSVLFASHPSGVMPEEQVEAVLWGFFYRVSKTRDRRASAGAVGERPRESKTWNEEEGRWVSDAGEAILGSGPINRATGLPESEAALLPKHRAIYGWDLATQMIIPPEDFVAMCVYTDDVPQNLGKSDGDKEWVALCFKAKYFEGATGQPLAIYRCHRCDEEWEREFSPIDLPCVRCGARGFIPGSRQAFVEALVKDAWTDEEIQCVKENTRRLKRVLHRLCQRGFFDLKPKIGDHEAELGTKVLADPQDEEEVLGFRITPKGVIYAEAWAKVHPEFTQGHHLLDAMGPTLARKAPAWVQRDYRSRLPVAEIRDWF